MSARVRLRAASGEPLAEDSVSSIVVSTAEAIGERTGVRVDVISLAPDSIELDVDGSQLAATALAAELRRITDQWHMDRHGGKLWGDL